jgi:hypothetical protein
MSAISKHIGMLGLRVKDSVTGMEGVVTSISFDLYGCVQAIVHPGIAENGTMRDPLWFDVARLRVTDSNPVMECPNFDHGHVAEGRKGAADKPLPR